MNEKLAGNERTERSVVQKFSASYDEHYIDLNEPIGIKKVSAETFSTKLHHTIFDILYLN